MTFGKVTPADFNLPPSPLIDSNTNAVIIADVGHLTFAGNSKSNYISHVFKQNTRIKLINKKAFDLANIRVLLYGVGKWADKLEDLQASTYNLENGKVIETKLNLNDLFRDTLSKTRVQAKFTFPALKEGCIIEYAYTRSSIYIGNLPTWAFQWVGYPCLYNKYQADIPSTYGYLTLFHGQDSFLVKKMDMAKEIFDLASITIRATVKQHTWIMKDIPAFESEPFVEHPYLYRDMVEFQLLQTYDRSAAYGNIEWSTATRDLLGSQEFGAVLTPDASFALNNTIDRIAGADVDYMVAAKHIYAYIRDNFTCIPDNDIYLGDNLYAINKKKRGAVEDLNLLLVAMLRQKRINASPVILSTSDFGINVSTYPVLDKMNYVICMIKMATDTIFLDASQPLLGFGQLPLKCYNGHARIISDHDSGSIFLNREDIKEQKSTTVFIINDEKGGGQMSGTLETTCGSIESYDLRKEIKHSNETTYFKNIQLAYGPDFKLENTGIDSINKLDDPVKIHYDFNFKPEENPDIIYFNPILQSSYAENPLKAETRKFPIEMPYSANELYVLNMEIPKGYAVDEIPKSARVAYNGTDGLFEYLIQKTESNVQLRVHLKLNKATFPAEDYSALRDFFAYVAKKQSEQIVFKKIK